FGPTPLSKIKEGTIRPVIQGPENHEFFNRIRTKRKFAGAAVAGAAFSPKRTFERAIWSKSQADLSL
ncbi:hypothetical protein OS189_17525, partial [Sulfitobacter sp. F26169L]|uniref:hypothetical protein n=1 Tax=Sulfitobacter sp. F26169L TaxID=2996015 RepID=UPI002260F309